MQGLLGAIRGSQSTKEWRACGALIACALAFSLMTGLRETPRGTAARGRSRAGALLDQHCHHPGDVASSQGLAMGRTTWVVVDPWGIRTAALLCFFEALARLPLAAATLLQYTYPT